MSKRYFTNKKVCKLCLLVFTSLVMIKNASDALVGKADGWTHIFLFTLQSPQVCLCEQEEHSPTDRVEKNGHSRWTLERLFIHLLQGFAYFLEMKTYGNTVAQHTAHSHRKGGLPCSWNMCKCKSTAD